jgi:hypothetical protein
MTHLPVYLLGITNMRAAPGVITVLEIHFAQTASDRELANSSVATLTSLLLCSTEL